MRLVLVIASLIFSVLLLSKPATAFSFKRRVPESISGPCESTQIEFDWWKNDTVMDRYSSRVKEMAICDPDFRLWFWQKVDVKDEKELKMVKYLGDMRIYTLKIMAQVREEKKIREISEDEIDLPIIQIIILLKIIPMILKAVL